MATGGGTCTPFLERRAAGATSRAGNGLRKRGGCGRTGSGGVGRGGSTEPGGSTGGGGGGNGGFTTERWLSMSKWCQGMLCFDVSAAGGRRVSGSKGWECSLFV